MHFPQFFDNLLSLKSPAPEMSEPRYSLHLKLQDSAYTQHSKNSGEAEREQAHEYLFEYSTNYTLRSKNSRGEACVRT